MFVGEERHHQRGCGVGGIELAILVIQREKGCRARALQRTQCGKPAFDRLRHRSRARQGSLVQHHERKADFGVAVAAFTPYGADEAAADRACAVRPAGA